MVYTGDKKSPSADGAGDAEHGSGIMMNLHPSAGKAQGMPAGFARSAVVAVIAAAGAKPRRRDETSGPAVNSADRLDRQQG
jgi:hypothetical protein